MENCQSCPTPASISTPLSLHIVASLLDITQYRRVIGALQYLSMTRPDIAFIVNKLNQVVHSPTSTHWIACKRIYLKGSADIGLHI